MQWDLATVEIPDELDTARSAFKAKDYDKARTVLEPLAEGGNAEASYWLGRIYDGGLGVDADEEAAYKFYLKAAEGDFGEAQH